MAVPKDSYEEYLQRKKKIREYYKFIKKKENQRIQEIFYKILLEQDNISDDD